ncbi:ABC transporter permease [Microlunatus parietis]|uniref:Transport permease protein n=1 Tax=Microlunatus parietis TaxID=682979 RepID=A0A7Y9I6I7_9ACTN|nr:ABC transporter permease [Microlunatus parietis]NYE71197.1 ABC-2 type transport system permease protein [Microlunatus parietis]
MTTTTSTVTTPRSRTAVRGPGLRPVLHYTWHSTYLTAKNVGYVIFTFTLPLVMYVLFSQLFGSAPSEAGVDYSALIMVSMGSYGALGAAMSGGAYLAVERKSGWFRQLGLTALPPQSFLWARAAVTMILVLPSVLVVDLAGFLIGGVRAPLGVWLASIGLVWIALIPMIVLGLVIGLWVKTEAVGGLTTLLLMALALLGGLWLPLELMPSTLQLIGRALPSYWIGELGRFPFLPAGTAFPWVGIAVLAGWAGLLTLLGALGYRRAIASSRR